MSVMSIDDSHPRPSGPRSLKQERSVRTRELILRSAAGAFAAKGFMAVTVQEIAALSGMTKGAVYFHYENKESIALFVVQTFYRKLRGMVDSVRPAGATSLTAMVLFLLEISIALRDDPVVQAAARLQIERNLIDAELPPPHQDTEAAITALLEEAVLSGELPHDFDVPEVAQVLLSAVFGAQHISWVVSGRADVVERIGSVVRVVVPNGAALVDRHWPAPRRGSGGALLRRSDNS